MVAWGFLEQLALAALDVTKYDVADVCRFAYLLFQIVLDVDQDFILQLLGMFTIVSSQISRLSSSRCSFWHPDGSYGTTRSRAQIL